MNRTSKLVASIASVLTIITALIFLVERYFNAPADISGNWEIKQIIKESSYKPYIGKTATFKIFITQTDNEIEAKGEKWWIDDKEIPFEQHDPIILKGTVDKNKLTCTYTLKGIKRETTGIIEAEISKDEKSMDGTFSGTAADTKGPIKGLRKK